MHLRYGTEHDARDPDRRRSPACSCSWASCDRRRVRNRHNADVLSIGAQRRPPAGRLFRRIPPKRVIGCARCLLRENATVREKAWRDRDLWDERRRSYESEYFQRRERSSSRKCARGARELAEEHQMGQATGIRTTTSPQGPARPFGCTRETVTRVHLVPLLQVGVDRRLGERPSAPASSRRPPARRVEESTSYRPAIGWPTRGRRRLSSRTRCA